MLFNPKKRFSIGPPILNLKGVSTRWDREVSAWVIKNVDFRPEGHLSVGQLQETFKCLYVLKDGIYPIDETLKCCAVLENVEEFVGPSQRR